MCIRDSNSLSLVQVASGFLPEIDTQGLVSFQRASSSASTLHGDVDLSGAVTFADITPFITVLSSGGFQPEADCNPDGMVDFADIPSFINILSNQ